MAKRVHRKIEREAADFGRIEGIRKSFREERPSESDLKASGEYCGPIPMECYLEMRSIGRTLKSAREQAHMSLADASRVTGMDRGAISRLENSVSDNVTIKVLNRLASAYGKRVAFRMEDEPEPAR